MLNRRHFLIATAAATALSARMSLAQDTKMLQVFIDGDDDLAAPVVRRGRGQMTKQGFAGLALVAAPLVLLIGLELFPTVSMVAGTFHVTAEAGRAFWVAKYAAFFADEHSVENLRYRLVWTLISCGTALAISLVWRCTCGFPRAASPR